MNPLRQYISRNRRKQHFFTLLYMTPLVLKSLNGHYKVEAGTCVHIFHCTYMTHISTMKNTDYPILRTTHILVTTLYVRNCGLHYTIHPVYRLITDDVDLEKKYKSYTSSNFQLYIRNKII